MNKKKLKYFTITLVPLLFLLSGCDIQQAVGLGGNNSDTDIPELQTSNENTEVLPKPVNSNNEANSNASTEGEIRLSDSVATLDIDTGGRKSIFVPYREKNLSYTSLDYGDLPLPPMSGLEDENLSGLVSAKVTGILYDKNSPSAIINVMDEDYIVKPGDIIESFKIANISKDFVAIKTGSNVYRAKVGDIVDGELYGTGVYNLGHKFAGHKTPSRKEDIVVVASKKKDNEQQNTTDVGFNELSLPPIPELKINKLKAQSSTNLPLPPAGTVPKIDTN